MQSISMTFMNDNCCIHLKVSSRRSSHNAASDIAGDLLHVKIVGNSLRGV